LSGIGIIIKKKTSYGILLGDRVNEEAVRREQLNVGGMRLYLIPSN